MKKILMVFLLLVTSISISGCRRGNILLLLNWGEYINDEIVEIFEERYNCTVSISLADSNELFYSKVMSGTTAFDLVIPSEYMIQKMIERDLLQEIDFTKLENYNYDAFTDSVRGIIEYMEDNVIEGFKNYQVPYFWGTFGIMYNQRKAGLADAIKEHEWDTLFDKDNLPTNTRTGMYNVPRFAYAAASFALGKSPNTFDDTQASLVSSKIIQGAFTHWGTDMLKKSIRANNLDMAFLYTGDFLDTLFIDLADGISRDEIRAMYELYIPDNTIAFMDSLVIPKKARHVDLAHQFLDFMLEPEIAFLNASVVGYATTLQETFDLIAEYQEGDELIDIDENDVESLAAAVAEDEWRIAWRDAYLEYYAAPSDPTKRFKGTPLANFEPKILDRINILVNNAKDGFAEELD